MYVHNVFHDVISEKVVAIDRTNDKMGLNFELEITIIICYTLASSVGLYLVNLNKKF